MRLISCAALLLLACAAHAKVIVRPAGDAADVEFQFADPQADRVSVAGNFNQWSVGASPMRQGPGGLWTFTLQGVKRSDVLLYKFVVGSSQRWVEDAEAPDTTSDFKGGRNGQVAVARYLPRAPLDEVGSEISRAKPQAAAEGTGTAPTEGRNLFDDAGFESGSLQGWTLQGDGSAVWVERDKANAHGGEGSLKYTLNHPFKVMVYKRFTHLQPGSYSFRAWVSGGGGENQLKLFAYGCSDDTRGKSSNAPIVNTGWQQWRRYALNNIEVTGSECIVGLYIDGNADNWGNVDDVEFRRNAAWVRLGADPAQ